MVNFKNKVCIVGSGGFARETLTCLIDCISGSHLKIADIAVFMVKDADYNESEIMGIPVIKDSEFNADLYEVVVAIGDPTVRKRVVQSLPANTKYATIIHPTVIASEWVKIGKGSIVTAGTVLTCDIKIGDHCHLNLNTTIGHCCDIGDFFTTAPGVNISGNCNFGDCVFLGSNAACRQGIQIVDNATIGMGSVVVKNVLEPGIYLGNPAKKLERKVDSQPAVLSIVPSKAGIRKAN